MDNYDENEVLASVERFNSSIGSYLNEYAELDSECKKYEAIQKYIDEILKPKYERIEQLRVLINEGMAEVNLTSFKDDKFSISRVKPTKRYSLKRGLDASVIDDLKEQGYVTESEVMGYVKVKVIQPEDFDASVSEELKGVIAEIDSIG